MRSAILTLKRAKTLRRTMTRPEVLLWTKLRRRIADAPIWRRQHPLGPYIADFYCPAARLVAEIDGHIHGDDGQRAHDVRRDHWMTSQGLRVERILASSVFDELDDVADGLRRLATELSGVHS
jgi:very-short-patch-repair endonuclease